LCQSRHLVGGGLRPVATGLQTGSTVAIISKLSSVPKLYVATSSSLTLRPPPLVCRTPSRIHAATSVAKQTPCWWRSLTGGYGLQTGSAVPIISKLSSLPKLHEDRSSSEKLRPPPMIYWAQSRIHTATSVAKQRLCWWRSFNRLPRASKLSPPLQ